MLLGQSLGQGINTCYVGLLVHRGAKLNHVYAMTPLSILWLIYHVSMLLSMIISVPIMMLTLLVYRLIVAGLTQSF